MQSPRRLMLLAALCGAGCGGLESSIPSYSDCQDDGIPNTESGVTPFAAELLVPNVDLGVQWYRDTAGFRLLYDAAPERSCFAELELEGAHILLAHVDRAFEAPDTSIELRFTVGDVDALYARLVERGAEIKRDLADQEYGLRDFITRDVYGFRVRFASPLP